MRPQLQPWRASSEHIHYVPFKRWSLPTFLSLSPLLLPLLPSPPLPPSLFSSATPPRDRYFLPLPLPPFPIHFPQFKKKKPVPHEFCHMVSFAHMLLFLNYDRNHLQTFWYNREEISSHKTYFYFSAIFITLPADSSLITVVILNKCFRPLWSTRGHMDFIPCRIHFSTAFIPHTLHLLYYHWSSQYS